MKVLTERGKKDVYNIIAESYIDLVSRGVIGKFERKVVSRKVLDAMEMATTYEDIYTFINSLVSLYPAFSTALVKIKNEINKVHEEQVMDHLQSYLKAASK